MNKQLKNPLSPYITGVYDYEYSEEFTYDLEHLKYLLPPFMRLLYQLVEEFLDELEDSYEDNNSPLLNLFFDKETLIKYARQIYWKFSDRYADISTISPFYQNISKKELTDIINTILAMEMYNRKRRIKNINGRLYANSLY